MQPAAVVFNPLAGRGRAQALLADIQAELARSGFDANALPTREAGDATIRAREAVADGAEVVFALGGDGTLRECACAVLGSDSALGFLPAGTVNVMALELGLPQRPLAAARALRSAQIKRRRIGLAGEVPFLMQASAGVDAFLIASMRTREKRWLGWSSTLPAVFRSLARYRFPTFEVSTDSGIERVTHAVASGIERYGGPWKLTPGAGADGGATLDLFLYRGRGRLAAMAFATALLVGRHLKLAGSSVERVERASLSTADNLPFQIDGDLLGPIPASSLEVSTSKDELALLVPARNDSNRFQTAP